MLRISSDLWAEPTWHRSHPCWEGSGGSALWEKRHSLLDPEAWGPRKASPSQTGPVCHAHEQRYKTEL